MVHILAKVLTSTIEIRFPKFEFLLKAIIKGFHLDLFKRTLEIQDGPCDISQDCRVLWRSAPKGIKCTICCILEGVEIPFTEHQRV